MREAVDRCSENIGLVNFLGICVGMQLIVRRAGWRRRLRMGFGWIAGDVEGDDPAHPSLKIPQIGWNTLDLSGNTRMRCSTGLGRETDGPHAYFVHSYHLDSHGRR